MRKQPIFCWATVLLLAAVVSSPSGAMALDILFVHDLDATGDGSVAANAAADTAMINRLQNILGHTVDPAEDSTVTAAVANVRDYDFVVVSSTASSSSFGTNNSGDGKSGAQNVLDTDATVVMMEGGNGVVAQFNLTGVGGATGQISGTTIDIVADDGYVTAGFAPGPLQILSANGNIGSFGVVPPQGTLLGFPQFDFLGTPLGTHVDAALFNLTMVNTGTSAVGDNLVVPLPFHNGAFSLANANGLQLFDNVFIPEPTTALLVAFGSIGLLRRRRSV